MKLMGCTLNIDKAIIGALPRDSTPTAAPGFLKLLRTVNVIVTESLL